MATMNRIIPGKVNIVTWILFPIAVTAVVILIVFPLVRLFKGSIITPEGELTFIYFLNILQDRALLEAFRNSMVIAMGATSISLLTGVPMAWAVSRTDIPLKNFIRNFTTVSMVTPPFLGAIAWVFLLGPGAGKFNIFFRFLFNTDATLYNIFSLGGITFVISMYAYPFVFLYTTSALDNMDANLEDAANILGSNKWKTLYKITLPLIAPAIISGAILSFLEALALFGVPAVLGMSRGIFTLTTRIYQLFNYPPDYEQGAAMAVPLIIITGVLLIFQFLYLRKKQFTIVSGKSSQPMLIRLGIAKWPILGYCLLVISLSVIIPYFMLLIISLSKIWGAPLTLSNLTLANYNFIIFDYDLSQRSFLNSAFLSFLAATIAVFLGLIITIYIKRTENFGRRFLHYMMVLPFAIPGIAMAVAFLWAYIRPPFNLYGTIWILLVAYIARRVPLCYMSCSDAMTQINSELEESSRILGASWFKSIFFITIPLLKLSLVSGWMLVFITSFRELSASILLYSPNSEVIAVTIISLFEEGEFEALAALSIIILTITLVFIAGSRKIVGKGFAQAG
ncbi:ABC transporter permease [Thermodesulfobacteriota bacterium]